MFEYSVEPFDFKFTLAYLSRQNFIPIHADKNESQIYFKKDKKLIVNEKS